MNITLKIYSNFKKYLNLLILYTIWSKQKNTELAHGCINIFNFKE